jgi:2-oxoglutarate dehydrogenase E2 component (dihydrolipoamide succinyltransferase)
MQHPIKAPTVGESITEVRILKWLKPDGAAVKSGESILEIETDKATVEVAADASGALKIGKPEGETVRVGDVIGMIDDAVQGTVTAGAPKGNGVKTPPPPPGKAAPAAASMSASAGLVATPAGIHPGGRVSKESLLRSLSQGTNLPSLHGATPAPAAAKAQDDVTSKDRPGDRRVPMTRIRAKIAENLVMAQRTAAILTTFNEVDMSAVMELRNKHKESFKAKHGVNLSFMSFFTRGVVLALKAIPAVNASIDGKDTIYHDYYDIGVAVGTEHGLVVPVIRGAESLSFVQIEKTIGELAVKARDRKLSIAEMTGGTFTISNGGTYGSLLSTPILNPPQSGILGMHKIEERPMAIKGQVVVRPMMYIALSYDHRIIDGKEAVTFLVTLKDLLENPEKLGLDFV